jgi:hypothetical protein
MSKASCEQSQGYGMVLRVLMCDSELRHSTQEIKT